MEITWKGPADAHETAPNHPPDSGAASRDAIAAVGNDRSVQHVSCEPSHVETPEWPKVCLWFPLTPIGSESIAPCALCPTDRGLEAGIPPILGLLGSGKPAFDLGMGTKEVQRLQTFSCLP